MSGRRTLGIAVAGLCAALLLPAARASADASPADNALPKLTQSRGDFQAGGCLKGSDKTVNGVPWPQAYLNPQNVWPLSEGNGVTVAVLGSGVEDTEGMLAGRLTLGPRENGTGGSGSDCVGHGTFVAGLIAAQQRPGVGLSGIAPQARVLAIGVTDESGTTNADALARGIRAAADGGARVICVAVPSASGSADLMSAVQYAMGKGAVVLAPAAADGQTQQGKVYPAAYSDVVAVSDLGPDGSPPQGGAAGRIDLVAPGDAVTGVGPRGTGYLTASGPSFATGFVAGAAALAVGYRPDLTASELVHRLEATAYHPGTTLPDPQVGYGTIDPVAAVSALLPEESGATSPPPHREQLAMPPRADTSADVQALEVGAGSMGVVAVVAAAAVLVPRGRRRRWRPGRPGMR